MMDEKSNQHQNFKFLKRPFGKKNPPDLRSGNPQWFSQRSWLHYDEVRFIYLFTYLFIYLFVQTRRFSKGFVLYLLQRGFSSKMKLVIKHQNFRWRKYNNITLSSDGFRMQLLRPPKSNFFPVESPQNHPPTTRDYALSCSPPHACF